MLGEHNWWRKPIWPTNGVTKPDYGRLRSIEAEIAQLKADDLYQLKTETVTYQERSQAIRTIKTVAADPS